MLSSLIDILALQLRTTGLFSNVHSLARRVSDGTITFPAIYTGNGQLKQLEWDKASGMCYFRKRSNITYSEDKNLPKTVSCAELQYQIRIPLRLVCFLNTDKAGCDNAFNSDFFAELIISDLTQSLSVTGVRSANVISSGYETDSISVLQSEYSNWKDIIDINYNYSYFSIDFEVEIIASKSCISACHTEIILINSDYSPSVVMQPYRIAQTPNTHAGWGTLAGVINGINKTFTVPESEFKDGSLFITYNGQFTGDFTENGTTGQFTTNFTPLNGKQITAWYLPRR